jgi:hypothetical protein
MNEILKSKENRKRELEVAEELAVRKIKKIGIALIAAQSELEKIREQRQKELKNLKEK